jgi:site-specific recombinase XerC
LKLQNKLSQTSWRTNVKKHLTLVSNWVNTTKRGMVTIKTLLLASMTASTGIMSILRLLSALQEFIKTLVTTSNASNSATKHFKSTKVMKRLPT